MKKVYDMQNYILDNYTIDGIECYYTTFTPKQHEEISNICKQHHLLMSGGSDFHGTCRPEVDIAKGYGNLETPTEVITNWISKISFYNTENFHE